MGGGPPGPMMGMMGGPGNPLMQVQHIVQQQAMAAEQMNREQGGMQGPLGGRHGGPPARGGMGGRRTAGRGRGRGPP